MSQYRNQTSERFGFKDELLTVNVELLLNIPLIPSCACLFLFLPLVDLCLLLAPATVRTPLLDQCGWLLKRTRARRITQHLRVAYFATENVGISLLQLLKHFWSVLRCHYAAG